MADNKPILHETTKFVFHAGPKLRAVDRITTRPHWMSALSSMTTKRACSASVSGVSWNNLPRSLSFSQTLQASRLGAKLDNTASPVNT